MTDLQGQIELQSQNLVKKNISCDFFVSYRLQPIS